MLRSIALGLALLLTPLAIAAQDVDREDSLANGPPSDPENVDSPATTGEASDTIPTLDTMMVTGEQPGPGLWKVSKGDNVLWILGTISPLPRKLEWYSLPVERVIRDSAEIIVEPTVKLDADIGYFRGMLLLPSLYGARKNPDGATLRDVLPPDLYARWLPLKAKYLGRDAGIEKWRPIFAAQELYSEAIKDYGMSMESLVRPVIEDAAKRYKIPITRPRIAVKLNDPKAAIKQFSGSRLADGDCFAKTMLRLETDLDAMRARANAWAIGDLEELRRLPYSDQNAACRDAIMSAAVVQERGMQDLRQRSATAWLQAAEAALANNASSFASLPMAEILKPDGYVAMLRAKGYLVEEP